MINPTRLTEPDKGKWVKYTEYFGAKPQFGRIKSWNDKLIFVVYSCNNEWDRYQDFTGEGTPPNRLKFKQNDEKI